MQRNAVCCSVLQCVAVCCSNFVWVRIHTCILMDAFLHVKGDHPIRYFCEVCCSVLQRIAVYYSVLQCVAVCCSVLQCVAVCYSLLQFLCVQAIIEYTQ